jgi:hypothetical protein
MPRLIRNRVPRPAPIYGTCKAGCPGVRRLSHTGYCRVCFEMGAPRPISPTAPWLDAALTSPAALARLDAIGAEIARERADLAQLEANREAFRLAALRANACQQEAAERAQMAELEEVDDADLRSLAPDLYRLSHLPQNEP